MIFLLLKKPFVCLKEAPKQTLCSFLTSTRLHAQTLPDATPPMGQINPSIKIAVTFEPLNGIVMPFDIQKVLDHYEIVYFIIGRDISDCLGVAAP